MLDSPTSFHVLPMHAASREVLALPDADRRAVVASMVKHAGADGFARDSLTAVAPMAWHEEAVVVLVMLVWLGGPLIWAFGGLATLVFGGWGARAFVVLGSLALALHPMPGADFGRWLGGTRFTLWLYKYFSYRFVWCDDDMDVARESRAWIGAGPPHGVLPFANVLSIPAINTFGFRAFRGAPASVVFRTPFLRYLTLFPCVGVDRTSIIRATDAGTCVGIVPDGVAGIFRMHAAPRGEFVALRSKKGLARLALRTGTPILPAYSFGNTQVLSCWYDSFGILEAVSRRLQASLFVYWGRWGLPIPRRAQITMVFGRVIDVPRVDAPTDAQIDELHERILSEMRCHFDRHKAALGWGDRELHFV
ncbi:hypothetical protein KFE25_011120 [Diacronema lutheri]|uniref:Acyltransferase n=1 Tax=Diacronema lutheri TaxID=2081491 RepID=A0A6T5ZI12_DIALT|nr:hypothetical protein KFE25_011120 [Diacronema lutheri]